MGRYCSKACSNKARRRTMAERFNDFFSPGDPDACWIWGGPVDRDGYGIITDDAGRQVRAHRVAYEMQHGQIEAGKYVLHSCDNPPCCNPKHLRDGTNSDNVADKVARGRQAKGEGIGRNLLSADEVRRIRSLYGTGPTQQQLAEMFNVSVSTIQAVTSRRIWKHVE